MRSEEWQAERVDEHGADDEAMTRVQQSEPSERACRVSLIYLCALWTRGTRVLVERCGEINSPRFKICLRSYRYT